jgi:threonylcarbamoyladenosine tRNA methylthiotransferase CDKAL1
LSREQNILPLNDEGRNGVPVRLLAGTQAAEKKTKIFVEGHGCSASLADTEMISGLVQNSGYELVEDETEADLSVLVTCSVKTVTEQRMLHRIRELSAGHKKMVVAGCLGKAEPDKVLQISRNASIIGPNNLNKILPAIDSTLRGRQLVSIESSKLVKLNMPRVRKNEIVGIVEISTGCLSSCTFCQVKLVKGTVFSYPEDQIVNEVKLLVSQGAKEIWLTSTDNSAYGRDSTTSLAKLLRKVCLIEGEFKVRVGMMNPLLTRGAMLDEIISAFQSQKVFRFLHLPVQSGSERILKLMQRGYSIDDYYATIEAFRSQIPDLTLSTDIIVGFPTETEADFEDTIDLIRKSKPDVLNLSRFGAREGTKAAKMGGQVEAWVSKERSSLTSRIWKDISLEKNHSWIGWKGEALVDETVKGAIVARNQSYKPCVLKNGSPAMLGKTLVVKVTGATSFTLTAEISRDRVA